MTCQKIVAVYLTNYFLVCDWFQGFGWVLDCEHDCEHDCDWVLDWVLDCVLDCDWQTIGGRHGYSRPPTTHLTRHIIVRVFALSLVARKILASGGTDFGTGICFEAFLKT